MGGDCLNVGCVPSKGLIRASRAAHEARTAGEFGITCGGGVSIDFGRPWNGCDGSGPGSVRMIPSVVSARSLAVDVFLGKGTFTGPDRIEVDGLRLHFKKAAICTGARAAAPRIPGIEETGYLTNENVFWLTELPKRLLVIGGGPIGCELSQAFARMGSKVTIIEPSGHLLMREDADAAEIVQKSMLRDGVELALNTKITNAVKRGNDKIITIDAEWKDPGARRRRDIGRRGKGPERGRAGS